MLAPVGDESSAAPAAGQRAAAWKYIRVPSLGFLPGLVCPHHDRKLGIEEEIIMGLIRKENENENEREKIREGSLSKPISLVFFV